MSRKKNLEKLINRLNESKTEKDIFDCLLHLVKGFGVHEYHGIFQNPFYKSLLPDVKKDVLEEIKFLRNSLETEIQAIDLELNKPNNSESKKLESLKRDCISLIYEINERKSDIENLN